MISTDGHDLAQANLYCYGRLTWDPSLTSEEIAREWVVQTFGSDPVVVDTITGMLMDSYSIYESYTAPLGIGWMVNPSHHYGPSVDAMNTPLGEHITEPTTRGSA
jgi:alpha-glucuronidase